MKKCETLSVALRLVFIRIFLRRNIICLFQGGGAGAHGQVERQVRVSVQDECQRIDRCPRPVHPEDIREKGRPCFLSPFRLV